MERLLVVVIGAASLAGQVSWARIASAVVGGTFAAEALTLSGAMAGLSAGAWLAGAALRRRNLLKSAVLACGAALALMPPLLLQIQRLEGWPLSRRVLAAGLLALGHLPFGMVLPFAAARRGAGSGGALYGFGALGAALGVFAGGAWMALDLLGLLLGAVVILAGFLACRGEEASTPSAAAPDARGGWGVAFALGFLGLVVETLWLRILGFYWESNAHTFARVTGSVVAGLALGGLAASRRRPGPYDVELGLAASAVALATSAALAPLAAGAFEPGERLAAALALVGLPAACMGATFVFLLAGRSIALLSAANGAGAAAGPLVLWLVAPWVSWPPRTLLLAACGTAALMVARRRPLAALALAGLLAGLGRAAIPEGPSFDSYGVAAAGGNFDATVMPFVRPGLAATVAVSRDTRSGMEILWIDRGFQGDTSPLGRRIPRTLGRVPRELLGRPPRRALAIGLGTGITLSGLMEAGARSADVAELCEGVIEANRTILAEANGRVLELDDVRVLHADGRAVLADAELPYDLIVADMIFPTVVGAGNLFSREFYGLARKRLAADGLFVHWLPAFLLSPEDFASACAAFLEAFPDGSAWIGYLGPRRFIAGLAGGAIPSTLPEAVAGRRLLGAAELRAFAAGAAPLRDADPRLERRSARGKEIVSFGPRNLRDWLERSGRDDAWRLVAEAGFLEDGEAALALYRRAAAAAPGRTDAEFMLECAAYERHLESARRADARRDERALLASLREAAASPLHGGGNLRLGGALAARGWIEEALAEFERAVEKSPRSADALMNTALLAYAVRDLPRARRALKGACRLRPDRPPLYQEAVRRFGGS